MNLVWQARSHLELAVKPSTVIGTFWTQLYAMAAWTPKNDTPCIGIAAATVSRCQNIFACSRRSAGLKTNGRTASRTATGRRLGSYGGQIVHRLTKLHREV